MDWSATPTFSLSTRLRPAAIIRTMALRRVFVDRIEDREARATGSSAHHLARSVRLRPGEAVEISDQSRACRAVTVACSPTEVRFRVEEELQETAPAVRMDAALAIIRFSRFEWAVEKLTELGVCSVTPIVADRSDTKLVAASAKRVDRWRRIAFEAAQQARRLAAPFVGQPTAFDRFVRSCRNPSRIIAQPGGPPVRAPPAGEARTFLVGPEGGWTAAEERLAHEQGFALAGLGETILRSETAAVALAAISTSSLREGSAQ